MKKLHILGMLIGLLLMTSNQALAEPSISVSVNVPDTNLGELLLVGAAALFFDLDVDVALEYQTETESAESSISLMVLSKESDIPPKKLIEEKKKGRGWGAIAQGKMPPGLAKKWRLDSDLLTGNDNEFETTIVIQFLSSYYGIPNATVCTWLEWGLPVLDIALSLNLAHRAQVQVTAIVNHRLEGYSWPQIASRYKIPVSLLQEPVDPKTTYNTMNPTEVHPSGKDKNKKKN
jgi:hypothetical protein